MTLSLSLRERAVLRLYGALMRLARPVLRRKLARRARREPGYAEAVPERFGHYTQAAEERCELVWVHAVSLGETRAAAILLQAWRAQQPGLRVLLTHGTATGRAEGRALLRPGDVQVWQPWDDPAAVGRFLAHFRPRLGVLMETEVWPQLVAGARAQGLPLVLLNARLSDKTLRQAQRWPALARPAYAGLAAALAQTEADAQRLRQLGARVPAVLGNLKFDAQPDAAQLQRALALRAGLPQPVLMFASSREGEEALFLQALQGLGTLRFQPLIVPRHPQRFDAVAQWAQNAGWTVSRRSSWGADLAQMPPAQAGTLWLGDSLGEMALYYGLSQAALLGGSFLPLGGQNLIEAAACGCPVLMGPHTFNFSEVAERALAEGAALRVQDLEQALALAAELLATERQQALSRAAQAFALGHRGAAQRAVAALAQGLPA
jgi:3-deoxy-D-manno-octulosonic-acid transferase